VSRIVQILVVATLAILAATGAWAAADQAPSSGQASSPTSGTAGALTEVTVTGKRAELEPRVSAFVNHIAERANGEGFARWVKPVCPLVSGLPSQEGEFVLERVSEIARAAGVPLAGEHCRPNLYILVTADPKALLEGMEKRNRAFTFGRGAPSDVDEFIATPRAVRVWYNSTERAPEGALFVDEAPISQVGGLIPGLSPSYNLWAQASHLTSNAIATFSHLFVVVDQTRLHAVSRGQLADYVGMVGLAQIKPAARLGDAPTILRLFDGTPQAAPPALSDWDLAFLKSLYGTEQKLKLQREQIARSMVREIVP
jgi:hypothetical protein